MSKVTVETVTTDYASKAILNSNFTALQEGFENTLSLDGTSPNSMGANLDMNSNRILNLPAPISSTEPARYGDINTYVEAAANSAALALSYSNTASTAAITATANPSYPMVRVVSHAALVSMTWSAMKAAQCIVLDSFYENGKTGGNIFVWRTGSVTPDGYYIIAGSDDTTGSNGALYCVNPRWLDVDFGSVEGLDNTAALTAMIAAGQGKGDLHITIKNNIISSTIPLYPHVSIVGVSGDNGSYATKFVSSMTTPVFLYHMDANGDGSELAGTIKIRDVRFDCMKGIEIGSPGDGTGSTTDAFTLQALLMNVELTNISHYPYTYGAYSTTLDSNADTGTEISDIMTFADSAGFGIRLSKCYRAQIKNFRASGCGVGVALRGCDMSVISDSFVNNSGRGFHAESISTAGNNWGGRVQFRKLQVSGCRRVGWIFHASFGGSVIDCYPEGTASSTGVTSARVLDVRARNTYVSGGCLDGNNQGSSGTPLAKFGSYGVIVNGLSLNPSTNGEGTFAIDIPTSYDTSNPEPRVNFVGCADKITTLIPEVPGIMINGSDPRKWSPRNPKSINGTAVSAAWPWTYNSTVGKYVTTVTSGAKSILVYFNTLPSDLTFKVYVTGIWTSASTGYAKATWNSTSVYAGYMGPTTGSTALQTVSTTLTRPTADTSSGTGNLYFEFVTDQVALYEIMLVPNS